MGGPARLRPSCCLGLPAARSRVGPPPIVAAARTMAVIDLSPFNSILARLEGVAERLEKGASTASTGAAVEEKSTAGGGDVASDPAIVLSLDAWLKAKLPALEAAAKESGMQDLTESTEFIVAAFGMLRDLLVATGHAAKPKDEDWAKIFVPLVEMAGKAGKACDNQKDSFQSRKAAAETLNVVSLVTQNSPPEHVRGVLESVDYHVLKVTQKKNPPEVAWARALKDFLKGLVEWCTENCKLGVMWKHGGQAAAEYFALHVIGSQSGGSTAKAKDPGPPQREGSMLAVMGAVQGFSTSGLRKVADADKTKNRPAEERSAVVPASAPKAATPAPTLAAKGAKGPKGPPIMEFQRSTTWTIENQDGAKDLVLEQATMGQLVAVINCRNSTVHIKTKVKSISIDGCEKVNVICHDVVSAVEFVNSDRCALQTTGTVNSIAIDKCNGINLFLPKESLHAEIVTSKSSEMNVTIPDPDTPDDTVELPIPEQFVTKILPGKKKLQSEVSSLYS